MLSRLLLIYAVVELAAVAALVGTVGWGWTLLALAASFVIGSCLLAPIAGSHLARQIAHLRSGAAEPRSAATDGALVTLAALLVVVPGLVSTVLGLLLLIRPIRAAAAPGMTAVAMRSLRRRVPLITDAALFQRGAGRGYPEGRDYIDGEVVDVRDVRQPALPNEPRGGFPGQPGWD